GVWMRTRRDINATRINRFPRIGRDLHPGGKRYERIVGHVGRSHEGRMRQGKRSTFVCEIEASPVSRDVIEVHARVWHHHCRRRLRRSRVEAPDGRESFLFAHGIESICSIYYQALNETLAG